MADRILYVEDNLRNRILVKRVLEVEGYDVLEAEDGIEGYEKGIAETYDLILMDINLPDMDGYKVTKKLREEKVLTPIIALTANAMMGDREKALDAGCDGYISKPIDIDKLPEQVADFIEMGRQRQAAETEDESQSGPSEAPEKEIEEKQSQTKAVTIPIAEPVSPKAATSVGTENKSSAPTKQQAAPTEEDAKASKEPKENNLANEKTDLVKPIKKPKQEEKTDSSTTNNKDPLTDTGLVL